MTIYDWIRNREIRGHVTFSLEELKSAFGEKSTATIKTELSRLVKKGYVSSVYRGFYVVVPVQYQLKGVVPPVYYIVASGGHDNASDHCCAKNQVFFEESWFELELSKANTGRTSDDQEH